MKKVFFVVMFVFVFTVSNVFAEGPFKFFDDFSKFKTEYEEQGLYWEVVYTGEYWRNTDGGLKRDDAYMDELDVMVTIDTDEASLWQGGTLFVYFLSSGGGQRLTGDVVGDFQTASSIEAPRTSRLAELWYEQSFLDDKASILVGIHDYNSDFVVTEVGGLFVNSSFGTNADISAGPRLSFWPLNSLGTRFKYTPNESWDFLLGVYDGNPGDADISEHLPRSILASDQGAFIGVEVAHHTQKELPGTYKIGFWNNTGDFDDILDTDAAGTAVTREGNRGGYIIVDQMLYKEAEEQGLNAFFQLGGAESRVNEVDLYVGGGLTYKGLFPTRDKDEIGVAVAIAKISDDLEEVGLRSDEEVALELTYKAHICDNFSVQPDVQWIYNPGADLALDDAIVAGLRFEISL